MTTVADEQKICSSRKIIRKPHLQKELCNVSAESTKGRVDNDW